MESKIIVTRKNLERYLAARIGENFSPKYSLQKGWMDVSGKDVYGWNVRPFGQETPTYLGRTLPEAYRTALKMFGG